MTLPTTWIGSCNKTAGRSGFRPDAIVIHIMEGTLAGTDEWFNDPESKVSAHYGIGRNGQVHQYVREGDTAYHAGRVFGSTWSQLRVGVNPNLYTVGIEHEGQEGSDWPDDLYQASAELVAAVGGRWGIPLDRAHVIGHRKPALVPRRGR
jgi:N-acetylmuramoyl-L-alanine amidase